jgi:hypothetical protein
MDDLIERVKSVLMTTPERWNNLVDAISAEALSQQPMPKEWSAIECLQHLIDTERNVFPVRVRAFLAGQDFPAFNPDVEGSKADKPRPVEMAAEFAHLRAESLTLLASVTPADLSRTARHAELGIVSLEEMLNEWAGHDLMHTVQAERALMQPFLRACGPWRFYFADHDAELPKQPANR